MTERIHQTESARLEAWRQNGIRVQAERTPAERKKFALLGSRAAAKIHKAHPQILVEAGRLAGAATAKVLGFAGMSLRAKWAKHLYWHRKNRKRTSRHIPVQCVFCVTNKTYEQVKSL